MNKRNQKSLLKKLLESAALDCTEPRYPEDISDAIAFTVASVANEEDMMETEKKVREIVHDAFDIDPEDPDPVEEILEAITERAQELAAERDLYLDEVAKVVADRMDLADVDEDGEIDEQALHAAVISSPIKIMRGGKEFAVSYVLQLEAVEVTPTIRIRLTGTSASLASAVADRLRTKIENSREHVDERQPAEPTKEPEPEIT